MATKQEKQWRFSIGYIIFTVVLILLLQQFLVPLYGPQKVPYSQFLPALGTLDGLSLLQFPRKLSFVAIILLLLLISLRSGEATPDS